MPTLRLDAVGLGDSDGDERRYHRASEFYRDDHLVPLIKALDELEARGLPGRFLLAGLCSSALIGAFAPRSPTSACEG